MKRIFQIILKIMLTFVLVVVGLLLVAFLIFLFHPAFGGKTTGEDLEEILASENYKNGKFQNFEPLNLMTSNDDVGFWARMNEFLFKDKDKRRPQSPLPSAKVDLHLYEKNYPDDVLATWLGHSTLLIRTEKTTIITDPIFSERASPVGFMGPKKFPYETDYSVEDLPEIDVVLISHDHYDHLDYKTILKLKDKVKKFYVPLGVKAHLLKWKVPEEKIVVMDWYDQESFEEIDFVFVPGQHFSGRKITDSMQTLWGGWVIETEKRRVLFTGDTGYSEEFKKIGEKYGPFDIAFVECGAYNERWSDVHLFPEETVQVAQDVGAKVLAPIHNSKFSLALHPWKEPLGRVVEASQKAGIELSTPGIGESFVVGSGKDLPNEKWWDFE